MTIDFDRLEMNIPNDTLTSVIDEEGKSISTRNGKIVSKEEILKGNKEIRERSRVYITQKKKSIRKSLRLFKMENSLVQNSEELDKAIEEGSWTRQLKRGKIVLI